MWTWEVVHHNVDADVDDDVNIDPDVDVDLQKRTGEYIQYVSGSAMVSERAHGLAADLLGETGTF